MKPLGVAALLALLVPAFAAERALTLPPAGETLRIVCAVGRDTRLTFPEPLRRLRGLGAERSALGLSVAQATPHAVLVVHPRRHPTRGSITFVGPTLEVRLLLETEALTDAASDPDALRLIVAEPATAAPGAREVVTIGPTPTPAPVEPAADPAGGASLSSVPSAAGGASPSPTESRAPSDAVAPSAPPVPPESGAAERTPLDLDALLAAEPVRIDRREGLPGQPALRLVDALRGTEKVFLRFRLEHATRTRIARVAWERGEITSFTQRPLGDTLLIVVELPRAGLSRRTRVTIETDTGLAYRFPLRAGTLAGLLRGSLR